MALRCPQSRFVSQRKRLRKTVDVLPCCRHTGISGQPMLKRRLGKEGDSATDDHLVTILITSLDRGKFPGEWSYWRIGMSRMWLDSRHYRYLIVLTGIQRVRCLEKNMTRRLLIVCYNAEWFQPGAWPMFLRVRLNREYRLGRMIKISSNWDNNGQTGPCLTTYSAYQW